MNKFSMLLAWLVLWPGLACAQFTISGRVTDASEGTALPGAHIVIQGAHTGGFSDRNGQFQLDRVPGGTQLLEVSFMGYETLVREVHVTGNTTMDFPLERSATMAGEVVVMATRAGGRTAATYTNLGREEIMPKNLGQDLPFLIGMTPSVIVSSDAGTGIGYTWMNIRGSDQSRINVTLNGIPLNDSESHGVWWVNMPDVASSLDNLQIQRGAGLSTHGSGAFGATISLKSTSLRDQTYAELSTSAGSYNTMKNTLSFGTGLMNERWSFDGRLSRIVSDGYVDRASVDLSSLHLSGGYYSGNTMLKAVVMLGKETTYQAWNGVPGDSLATNRRFNPSGMFFDETGKLNFYENETDNYQQDHYQLHLSQSFMPELTGNLSLHYTYGRGYYEQYRQNERFRSYDLPDVVIGDETISRSDLIRRRWLDNHFYGLTYSLNYNSLKNTTATLGGGFHLYDGDHFGEIIWARHAQNANIRHRYYDNNGFKRDFNSFAKLTHELSDQLQAFVDLQYRFISYDFVGLAWVHQELQPLEQTAVFHFFNPKGGLSWVPNASTTLYAYAGIANREPVRRDFTESSPESRPRHETMHNVELGYRYAASRLKLGANLYLMNYRDQLVLTGEINDTGAYTRTNIDDSYRAGLELEAGYIFNRWLQWNGNATFSRNKIARFVEYSDKYDNNWDWVGVDERVYENTDIAFSPPVIVASSLAVQLVADLGLSLNTKYVGKRYIDNTMNPDRKLDAYLVHDLRLNYLLRPRLFRELELVLQVNNLLDAQYVSNAWIYKGVVGDAGMVTISDGYFPQAGRHYLVGLNLRF
jgi:iron complex outermembrane recepter protein